MLRQLPGTKFLFLPPYDTRTDTPKKYMDHLVRTMTQEGNSMDIDHDV